VSASLGELLATARQARGKTPQEAAGATRVRLKYLLALESDRFDALPAPVYVRGYLRTYASYLELDPAELLARYETATGKAAKPLALRPLSPLVAGPNLVLTAPAAGLVVVLALLAGLGAYVYRESDALRTPPAQVQTAPTLPPITSPSPGTAAAALPSPSPSPRTLHLTVTAADTVWIDAKVDGKPQFGDSGRILQAGDSVSFEGQKVTLRSGKGNATLINLDGKDLGPLGGGVVSKDFSA
jgi:cytoskeletal protein RodZ